MSGKYNVKEENLLFCNDKFILHLLDFEKVLELLNKQDEKKAEVTPPKCRNCKQLNGRIVEKQLKLFREWVGTLPIEYQLNFENYYNYNFNKRRKH